MDIKLRLPSTGGGRPLSETRTKRPPMPAAATTATTTSNKYLVDDVPSEEDDCYSSDYESYHESDEEDEDDDQWSQIGAKEQEEGPDEKSHEIRPATGKEDCGRASAR